MAIDIAAIKKKLASFENGGIDSSVNQWKPKPGTYKVRIVPWRDCADGEPFKEVWTYYVGDDSFPSPAMFNEEDRIAEIARKLQKTDWKLSKKLKPKMKAYAAIIVRGEDENAPLVWGFNQTVHKALLEFFTLDGVGDYTDPVSGIDIQVKVSQVPGKKFYDTTVTLLRATSPLADSPAKIKSILDLVPDHSAFLTLFERNRVSPDRAVALVDAWINAGAPESSDFGTMKSGGDSKESAAPQKSQTQPAQKKSESVDLDLSTKKSKKTSLDDAFEELKNM